MSYEDGYEKVELDAAEVSEDIKRIVIDGLMREGEFRFRALIIEILEEEIRSYKDEVDYEPNLDWTNGIAWAIHLIKNLKPTEY